MTCSALPKGFCLLSPMLPAICTGLAVSMSLLPTISVQLNPTNWNVQITVLLYRSLLCLSDTTQLFSELLPESLLGHAVLLHVLHEFSVQKVGICGSNVQEVKKEFP